MSYFSALARQAGIRVGKQPARLASPVRGIDVEETRTASPVTASSADRSPHPSAPSAVPPHHVHGGQPVESTPQRSDSRPASLLIPQLSSDTAAPILREVVVESVVQPPVVVVKAGEAADSNQADEDKPIAITSSAPPRPRSITVQPREPVPPQESRLLPSLQDVRRWVSQPPAEEARDGLIERTIERHALVSTAPKNEPATPVEADVETFRLDIGSIQITLDAPAPSPTITAPPRQGPAQTVEPSASWASRHYIRH